MGTAAPIRLSRDAWVDRGLRALAESGPEALNANALARALGVSRGSFYWHFENLEAFEHAVVAAWRMRTTEAVIAALESLPPGQGRLEALIERVLAGPEPTEAAIRRWAAYNPTVAEALSAVAVLRLRYVRAELEARGVVHREVRPTSPPSVEYSLTPLGEELLPALSAIVEVGHRLKAAAGRS